MNNRRRGSNREDFMIEIHINAAAVDKISEPEEYLAIKEGRKAAPLWLESLAQAMKKTVPDTLDQSIAYRSSMAFQNNKKLYSARKRVNVSEKEFELND